MPKSNKPNTQLCKNWYDALPKEFQDEDKFEISNPDLNITQKHFIIAGGTSSGKTQNLFDMIKLLNGTFDKIYIYSPNPEVDKLYRYLDKNLKKTNGANGAVIKVNDVNTDIIPLEQLNEDKHSQKLIVFDDLCNKKNQEIICDYYIACRKYNCIAVYITQNYYAVPSTIRKNAGYVMLKPHDLQKDLNRVLAEYGLTKKQSKALKDFCFDEPQNFIMIEPMPRGDKDYKIRKNFDIPLYEELKKLED
jgi:hypothetical protein